LRAGAIFAEKGQPFSKKDFKKLYKSYCLRGTSDLAVYRFGQPERPPREGIPAELTGKIAIRSAERLF